MAAQLPDVGADGWERSDFTMICESCLGDSPYPQMTKAAHDKEECLICIRPFTVFRWRSGRDARCKKTEMCLTCAKFSKVCQVCLLDLEPPVRVRDKARRMGCPLRLEMTETGEYFQQNVKNRYYGVNDPEVVQQLGFCMGPHLRPAYRQMTPGGADSATSSTTSAPV